MSTTATTRTRTLSNHSSYRIDVRRRFSEEGLPPIYNAVRVTSKAKGVEIDLTGEIQQHLGGGRVRCVALGSTKV